MVRKIGSIHNSTACQVDFQWFDVGGGLCGLFQVRDGLRRHFQLLTQPRTIDNFEYKCVCMLKTPQIKLTTSKFLGDQNIRKSIFQ